jgi:hypothetical protein
MAKGYKDKLAGTAIHFYVNSASDNSWRDWSAALQ